MIQKFGTSNTDEEFTNAYRSFYPFILRYCAAKTGGDISAAEDCTQEAFYVLYKKYCSNIEIENPKAYLIKTANNILLKKQAAKAKDNAYLVDIENADNIHDESQNYTQIEYDELLELFKGKLKEPDKTIFNLRYIEEKSIKEISEITGISITNITTRISRFRNKLKNEINDWRR